MEFGGIFWGILRGLLLIVFIFKSQFVSYIFKVSWLFWKFFGNSLGIFKRWRNMVGSIWFVLTFSKSADYFGNFFGILWKLSLIVYIFKSLIVGVGVWKFLIWEDFRLNGQGQGQGKTITRSASWRFLALKKIFFSILWKKIWIKNRLQTYSEMGL